MNKDEWVANAKRVAEETTVPDGSWWYLSFTNPMFPVGRRFLGACYVRGANLIEALVHTHALGINPGGEVMSIQVPDEIANLVPERFRETVMTREQCAECDEEIERAEGSHEQ